MKKLLIKTAILCVMVLLLPFILTILLRDKESEGTPFEKLDFNIYNEVNGDSVKLSFDDYIIGVVAANMPAGYNIEALKVQAVIARTYALYNISMLKDAAPDKNSFTTSELGLSYINPTDMENIWGSNDYITYFTKLENAVFATKDEVLVYDGNITLPVFFYCGSGYTRNSYEAWGVDIPYLRSVSSKQDVTSINYLKITEYDVFTLVELINNSFKDASISIDSFFEEVVVAEQDSTNYVTKINLGNQTISGEEFAKAIGLSSNHFSIENNNNNVRFICTGVGHGVGLSQYGANAMADEGYPYKEILAHYYQGTTLISLN